MSSREDKAVSCIEAAIFELQGARGLVREGRTDEARTQLFRAHAFDGAAAMYLDQQKAIELATEMELHAARIRARRPLRGRPGP
jgi:hypothetical protein